MSLCSSKFAKHRFWVPWSEKKLDFRAYSGYNIYTDVFRRGKEEDENSGTGYTRASRHL